MAGLFRRVRTFIVEQPAAAGAAAFVFVASAAIAAALVVDAGDRDRVETSATIAPTTVTSSTTTQPSTTTTQPATTTTATTTTTTTTTTPPPTGPRCVVHLHGKGGEGERTRRSSGVSYLRPTGNARAWDGRQWMYFPDDHFSDAVTVVADALDEEDCGPVIINGFSNGAAFAAKLYCRGLTFGDRVIRVVVDDPVVDRAVEHCDPDPRVEVTLYWTGALADTAEPGWRCSEEDWTCEGGVTIGIDAYADELDTSVLESRHGRHRWYRDAPELSEW